AWQRINQMAQDMEEDTFTGKMDWALWRRMLQFARPYAGHIAGLMTIGVLVAVWDASLPWFTGHMIDAVTQGDRAELHRLAVRYGCVIAAFLVCIFSFILVAGRIATSVSFDIRQAAFEKLQALPFAFYDRKAVGWLMARLTGDCNSLSRVMGWALLDLS